MPTNFSGFEFKVISNELYYYGNDYYGYNSSFKKVFLDEKNGYIKIFPNPRNISSGNLKFYPGDFYDTYALFLDSNNNPYISRFEYFINENKDLETSIMIYSYSIEWFLCSNIISNFSINDFYTNTNIDIPNDNILIFYELPQYGTIIRVEPYLINNTDFEYIPNFDYIELNWDKTNGVFFINNKHLNKNKLFFVNKLAYESTSYKDYLILNDTNKNELLLNMVNSIKTIDDCEKLYWILIANKFEDIKLTFNIIQPFTHKVMEFYNKYPVQVISMCTGLNHGGAASDEQAVFLFEYLYWRNPYLYLSSISQTNIIDNYFLPNDSGELIKDYMYWLPKSNYDIEAFGGITPENKNKVRNQTRKDVINLINKLPENERWISNKIIKHTYFMTHPDE